MVKVLFTYGKKWHRNGRKMQCSGIWYTFFDSNAPNIFAENVLWSFSLTIRRKNCSTTITSECIQSDARIKSSKAPGIIFRSSIWILIWCDTYPSVREFKYASSEFTAKPLVLSSLREQTATEMNSLRCQWEYDLVFAMQFILHALHKLTAVLVSVYSLFCATRLIPRKFNCRWNFRAFIHYTFARSLVISIHLNLHVICMFSLCK